MSAIVSWKDKAALLADELTAVRRQLHRFPELSFEERETARLVAERLTRLGLSCRTAFGGHGVVADIVGDAAGPVVALRADMDALPIVEETGLPFASERPGAMHACGHDAHTAMLLGAAELLVQTRSTLKGTVRLIFQSAEEINEGAKAMIREGVLDGVDEIYGLHNLPTLSAGFASVRPGPLMGSVDRIDILVEGKGAHGAIPDQGIDPILCAGAIVMSLQSLVSRETSPFDPVVVTIGSIHAGDANNVIPSACRMTGTVRAFDPDVRERLPAGIERIVTRIADSYRCSASLTYIRQTQVLINHPEAARKVAEAIDAVAGPGRRLEAAPTLAGEDFSEYLKHVPGCFFWLGSGPSENAEYAFGLHHPRFELNEACLPLGAALLAGIAARRLEEGPLSAGSPAEGGGHA
ncbi:M20 metallopeptidase family protein [Cohnella hashimotonis]|uniref:M20 family metallopeptidase n=1 Tax=Cohnella hashimotonis TaxID=2826895 RepID=A0ABT6TH56_9BACL|nr:M20 family metallopeptidase [Cohnella hashimotonis]MDI4646176.1 M20 family metallopeptidase [Cohnella hashimotonis]